MFSAVEKWEKLIQNDKEQTWKISSADTPHSNLVGGWCFPVVNWLEES